MVSPSERISLSRGLDFMAVGLFGLACCYLLPACHNSAGFGPGISFLYLFPLLLLTIGTLLLPRPPALSTVRFRRLPWLALAVLGSGPFFGWWLRFPNQPYFLICAFAGLYLLTWLLMELTLVAQEILEGPAAPPRDHLWAIFSYWSVIYLLGIPLGTLAACHIKINFFTTQASVTDLARLWMLVPAGIRLVIVAPIIATALLLWFVRQRILMVPATPPGSPEPEGPSTATRQEQEREPRP
jgi:hypothetical protein